MKKVIFLFGISFLFLLAIDVGMIKANVAQNDQNQTNFEQGSNLAPDVGVATQTNVTNEVLLGTTGDIGVTDSPGMSINQISTMQLINKSDAKIAINESGIIMMQKVDLTNCLFGNQELLPISEMAIMNQDTDGSGEYQVLLE